MDINHRPVVIHVYRPGGVDQFSKYKHTIYAPNTFWRLEQQHDPYEQTKNELSELNENMYTLYFSKLLWAFCQHTKNDWCSIFTLKRDGA